MLTLWRPRCGQDISFQVPDGHASALLGGTGLARRRPWHESREDRLTVGSAAVGDMAVLSLPDAR
jgi:hypothetical protein